MVGTYNALIAYAPMQPGLGLYDMHCVSNDTFYFLILCQPSTIFFVARCKLPEDKKCRWPNRAWYTQEEICVLFGPWKTLVRSDDFKSLSRGTGRVD